MGLFVLLPLVLPLTALPIARLAEQHLHPRTATRLLTVIGAALALCSTLCLGLLGVVGTALIPGNPLPDEWADPDVRDAVPFDEVIGAASVVAVLAVLTAALRTLWRHRRIRARARRALRSVDPRADVAVLPDEQPYAFALPGRPGRIVVSTGMHDHLTAEERHALLAHERSHLTGHHDRYLLAARLAACANPFLRPLQDAVVYGAERWADEDAAAAVGDRRLTARAVARAALVARPGPGAAGLPAFAEAGPVPRRVAALLRTPPPATGWPPVDSPAGLAAMMAAAGTAASAFSAFNATIALLLVLKAATPL
ncbi:M56 family metallopeptidase [Kitasatospora sp. NPDC054939]